jgi:phospholipid/cholesterol/gamma-HCH transport system substrate-binding protein
MPKESLATVTKRRLFGVLFIVIVVAFVSLSIAIYNKAFTDTTDVTLEANRTGNQLLLDSDVKVRGLVVGSVRDITSNGDAAKVKLSLMPDKIGEIPNNVRAQILPKTLFGEQYVSLIIPNDPSPQHIKQGDVIPQDRSKGALEAQTVLDHLFPVLTALKPADLNATLTAVATALNGRGNKLGETLVGLDKYLKELNPHTQTLVDDLTKLGKVAEEYNGVAPDIFDTLTNLQTSVKTVVEKQTNLRELFTTGADTSVVLSGFLDQNRERLISVADQGSKFFPLLARYSPEFTCLFKGINTLADQTNQIIHDGSIHLNATVDTTNQGKYTPGQEPKYITGYGPNCFGLPDNPSPVDSKGNFQIPGKYRCFNDGAPLTADACGKSPSAAGMRTLNSTPENVMVNTLIAGDLGTTPDKVPAAATILAAPLLRGNQVVLK